VVVADRGEPDYPGVPIGLKAAGTDP